MCTPNKPCQVSCGTKRPRCLMKVRFAECCDLLLVKSRLELKETGEARKIWYNMDELIKINAETMKTASLMKRYVRLVSKSDHVEQCLQLPQEMLEQVEHAFFCGHASRGIFHLCDERSRLQKQINKLSTIQVVLQEQKQQKSQGNLSLDETKISKVSRDLSRKARAMAHLRGVIDQMAAAESSEPVNGAIEVFVHHVDLTKKTKRQCSAVDTLVYQKEDFLTARKRQCYEVTNASKGETKLEQVDATV